MSTWDSERMGPMTPDTIRQLFIPARNFRVSAYEYPAGSEFSAAAREGVCYVLRGQVMYRFEQYPVEFSLRMGQYAVLPEGSRRVVVDEREAASIIMVWKIPDEFCLN